MNKLDSSVRMAAAAGVLALVSGPVGCAAGGGEDTGAARTGALAASADHPTYTIDVSPYVQTPVANPMNPYDAIGVFQNGLVDYMWSAATAAQAADPAADRVDEAVLALGQLAEMPPWWDLYCICVTQEGCPCKTLEDLMFPSPDPVAVSRTMLAVIQSLPPEPYTADEALRILSASVPPIEVESVQLAYQRISSLSEQARSGQLTIEEYGRRSAALERGIQSGTLSPPTKALLLQTAAAGRYLVLHANMSGGSPAAGPELPDPVHCAVIGAAVASWLGAIVSGAYCLVWHIDNDSSGDSDD